MLSIDIVGLALAVIVTGPRYVLAAVLCSVALDGLRALLAAGMGLEVRAVTVGGFLGHTAIAAGSPLEAFGAWAAYLFGPAVLFAASIAWFDARARALSYLDLFADVFTFHRRARCPLAVVGIRISILAFVVSAARIAAGKGMI